MLSIINRFATLAQTSTDAVASKPIRKVLQWQVYVTVALSLSAAGWAGIHAAISALLGGSVIVIAGLVYAIMISGRRVRSAGETLRTLVRAEISKLALIVIQLWLVLTTYQNVAIVAFLGVFIVVVMVYPLALLVRE